MFGTAQAVLIREVSLFQGCPYRGVPLYTTSITIIILRVFCKILNNRLVQCLDKEGALHEGQAGFRLTEIACIMCTL